MAQLKITFLATIISLLFTYTEQFTAFNSESVIKFQYSYTSMVPTAKLLSFKAEAVSHHNFSSLVTGILREYQFDHEFKIVANPQLQNSG